MKNIIAWILFFLLLSIGCSLYSPQYALTNLTILMLIAVVKFISKMFTLYLLAKYKLNVKNISYFTSEMKKIEEKQANNSLMGKLKKLHVDCEQVNIEKEVQCQQLKIIKKSKQIINSLKENINILHFKQPVKIFKIEMESSNILSQNVENFRITMLKLAKQIEINLSDCQLNHFFCNFIVGFHLLSINRIFKQLYALSFDGQQKYIKQNLKKYSEFFSLVQFCISKESVNIQQVSLCIEKIERQLSKYKNSQNIQSFISQQKGLDETKWEANKLEDKNNEFQHHHVNDQQNQNIYQITAFDKIKFKQNLDKLIMKGIQRRAQMEQQVLHRTEVQMLGKQNKQNTNEQIQQKTNGISYRENQ